jgi:hypothetical protein
MQAEARRFDAPPGVVTILVRDLGVRAMELLERASFLQRLDEYAGEARRDPG